MCVCVCVCVCVCEGVCKCLSVYEKIKGDIIESGGEGWKTDELKYEKKWLKK